MKNSIIIVDGQFYKYVAHCAVFDTDRFDIDTLQRLLSFIYVALMVDKMKIIQGNQHLVLYHNLTYQS